MMSRIAAFFNIYRLPLCFVDDDAAATYLPATTISYKCNCYLMAL
jgi:hypothetical protein